MPYFLSEPEPLREQLIELLNQYKISFNEFKGSCEIDEDCYIFTLSSKDNRMKGKIHIMKGYPIEEGMIDIPCYISVTGELFGLDYNNEYETVYKTEDLIDIIIDNLSKKYKWMLKINKE
jgi:hypothetical protein